MAIEEENKSKQLIHKEKPFIKWWNSLTAANKMILIAAVIGPVLTTILGSLFSEPVSNTASGGGIILERSVGR